MGALVASALTANQRRCLWAVAGEIGHHKGLDRVGVEALVAAEARAVSAQEHVSQLSTMQADQVISRLRALAAQLRTKLAETAPEPGPPGRAPGRLSEKQDFVLDRLFMQAGIDTLPRRAGFTRRVIRRASPSSQADFTALKEALTAIIQRAAPVDDVMARLEATTQGRLTDWERGFVADVHRRLGEGELPSPHQLDTLAVIEARQATAAPTQRRRGDGSR